MEAIKIKNEAGLRSGACSSRGFIALLLNIAPQPNRSTKAQNLHFCPYCYKPLLAVRAWFHKGIKF